MLLLIDDHIGLDLDLGRGARYAFGYTGSKCMHLTMRHIEIGRWPDA